MDYVSVYSILNLYYKLYLFHFIGYKNYRNLLFIEYFINLYNIIYLIIIERGKFFK
jgi:hypothetical protein